ncbi:CotH kinase family protein [Aureispira anguillae]|uniref:CotH kinase family protein n=1 Tax=Aureispira anguillae TaxID=2864201 RepID=A0A915YHS7_9BACT|nr:CotH kinase family protein [Aureispira anguillae]BDS13252.1 CotH kinase family protein [Aureispira anguillae]
MIIKTHSTISKQQKQSAFLKKGTRILLIILSFVIIGLILNYVWKTTNKEALKQILIADAETVKGENFVLNGYEAGPAFTQSSRYAYEGSHSIALSKKTFSYGFSTKIKDIHVGDIVTVQVWMLSPNKEIARLAVTSLDGKSTYVQSKTFEYIDEWQKIAVTLKIETPLQENTLKVYCFNFNEQPIYFDNLSYSKNSTLDHDKTVEWEPENIHIFVKEGEYKKLKQKRYEAIQQGLLINTDDSWVKAAIYPKNKKEEKIGIKMRLKGDWTDHLQGDKWSFRVQTQTDKAWNRLKTFSLQNPHTRAYLLEWVLHEFFKYEDILTTRYEFVKMKLNHKDLGVYVCEEHFLKQLPEFFKKKEGPIIRFVESGFWEAQLQQFKLEADLDGELVVGSPDIKPFVEGKTFKTPLLAEQYTIAQNLLYQYQYGLSPAKEIFDIDLLAKYYAIVDITGGYHGVAWHNQRYYYNPVTGKLEPIGFDGFGEAGLSHVPQKPFLGIDLSSIKGNKELHRKLFRDNDFLEKYHQYLEQFSDKAYLEKFVQFIKLNMYDRLSLLQEMLPDYQFNTEYLFKRARNIQNALYPNSASLQNKTVKPGEIAVCNRHQIPVKIIGSLSQAGGLLTPLDSPKVLYTTRFVDLPDYTERVQVPLTAKYLVYRVIGLDQNFYVEINKWPIPEAFSPVQELKSTLQAGHPAYLYHPEKSHIIFSKNASISEPIVIPEGYTISIKPGTTIDLTNNAFILSYSPVHFLGTEEAPIQVHSSDGSGRSFTVIQAKGQSSVNYTTFSNLGAFSYKGWNLPGAVNFYESDVDVYHSTFTKNSCEDALNIVRAKFDFQYNTVSHTYADGFDADFCTGTVAHCFFHKTGNDAIDFSTSRVTIRDSKIKSAGDKGISMGEQGTATILNTSIDDAIIGIASKDLSKTTVKNVSLSNCKTGFSAYQKKPEYGHGFIHVYSYSSDNLGSLHKILPGSRLLLIDQEIKGD